MAEGKIAEKDFERIMKALANRRRLAILRLLKRGDGRKEGAVISLL